MTLLRALRRRRDALRIWLILNYPLVWSLQVPRVLALAGLAHLVLWFGMALIPVGLGAAYVPSPQQVFYVLGMLTLLVALRWLSESTGRLRCVATSPSVIGGPIPAFILSSLCAFLIVSVPYNAAVSLRLHLQARTEELGLCTRWMRLAAAVDACGAYIRETCEREAEAGKQSRGRTCTPDRGISWGYLDVNNKLCLRQRPEQLDLAAAITEVYAWKSLIANDYDLDAVDALLRDIASGAKPEFEDSDREEICEWLFSDEPDLPLKYVHVRLMMFVEKAHSGTLSLSRCKIESLWLLAIYVALYLTLRRVVPFAAIQRAMLAIGLVWGAASFVSLFFFYLGGGAVGALLIKLYVSMLLVVLVCSLGFRAWRPSARLGLVCLLLSPVVPVLIAYAANPWSRREDSIVEDSLIEIFTELLRSDESEQSRLRALCVAAGWLVTAVTLVVFEWIARRARAVPE